MGGTNVEGPSSSSSPVKNKPATIFIPPRGPMDSLFTNGLSGVGFSPGPMTLVSSYFAEQSPFSFSQLLAMASPKPGGFLPDSNSGGNKIDLGFKEEKAEIVGEKSEGYKKNRPVNLVVNQSPQVEGLSQLFTGLSPGGLLTSPGFLSPLQSPFGMSHRQALAHVTAQAALSQSSTFMQMQAELQRSSSTTTSKPETSSQSVMNPGPSDPESSKVDSPEYSESDKKTKTNTSVSGDKPASDGYNWRKYGQKHVKGSECPRSYYKCTHPNCPVKKKVERSGDGRISEIIYKGHHNHDAPPSNNKRGALDKTSKVNNPGTVSHGQIENNNDWVSDEMALVSSDPANSIQRSFEHQLSAGNNEREGSVTVVDGGDDDEPIAKRRSIEMGPTIPVSLHQTVNEPKIVVQTRSEVDLLDDGFRWRKYGQKVVKGNPYPRSYYRCTYAGCNVRKHVERSSADPKSVITTYEGKHTHEIPVGKNQGTTNANSQQPVKTQKNVAKNPTPLSRETDFDNKDQMPTTLQLKQERVAA